jgi:LmbE family N-acetylglucosaminyl deacetylase
VSKTAGELPLSPRRVLAVSAHPDDAEFFAGATLARLAEGGAALSLVVCTDGSRGGRGLEDAAAVRRREQADAAMQLGIAEVVQLGLEDGRLAPDDALRERLVAEIRRVRPELVLVHDPRTLWTRAGGRAHLGHSDHRAAGTALLDAVYPRAASPNFHPGLGGEPWYPREIWLFDCAEADLRIAAPPFLERKLDALRAHASQEAAAGGLVATAAELARLVGAPGPPAEGFVRLRLW